MERVEHRRSEPVFNAVLWTLAEFGVDAEQASGSVGVDSPWGMVIRARDAPVGATPMIGDMDLRVSDEAKGKLKGLSGN